MTRKTYIITISLLLVSSLFLARGTVLGASESVTLKIGSAFQAFDVKTRTMQLWIDLVEKRTEGRVKGKIFPGGSLVRLKNTDTALSQGVADMCGLASSYLARHYPVFDLFGYPGFCAPNYKAAHELHDAVKPILSKILAKGKIKIMIPFYEGEMAAYLRKGVQPLLTNADWKGKKIRVPNKERAKLITSIGASAVVIPIGEVAMALQRGTVDGVLTGWPVGRAIKLEESAPNVTIINCATAQFGFAGMNMDTFERLSPADQQIMIQAGKEAGVFNGKLVEELREQYIQKIKGEGITPYFFSSQDIEAFLGKGYALMDESMKNASQEQVELYEILKQFRSQ